MSQKFIKTQNKIKDSKSFGKYYAKAVYDNNFIGTDDLGDFIQTQCSVKKSDIKAVLQELGEAMKHFFELGQKVKIDGIGIFKVGFSSIGVAKPEQVNATTITRRRVLFAPETERIVVGQMVNSQGVIKQKYVSAKSLLKDVVFEETHENASPNTSEGGGSSASPSPSEGGDVNPSPVPTNNGDEPNDGD